MSDFRHRNNNNALTIKGVKGRCRIEICIIAKLKIKLHLNNVNYKQCIKYLLNMNFYAKNIKINNKSTCQDKNHLFLTSLSWYWSPFVAVRLSPRLYQ